MHSYATLVTFLAVAAIAFERTLLGVLLVAAALYLGWN